MKAVMISIQPKWCAKIASGEKTIEVRKTRPKLETPFKCYIYMTKNGNKPIEVIENDNGVVCLVKDYKMAGKVVGEFVCDKIIGTCGWRLRGNTGFCAKRTEEETMFPNMSCLTIDEIIEYAESENREIYGWHISDLKIYDKPRELGEFYTMKKCTSCKDSGYESSACIYDKNCIIATILTRPPQSWCYVEEV